MYIQWTSGDRHGDECTYLRLTDRSEALDEAGALCFSVTPDLYAGQKGIH